jgi:superfamily II DNA or RNA helicase
VDPVQIEIALQSPRAAAGTAVAAEQETPEAKEERLGREARLRYIATMPPLQRKLLGEVQALIFNSGRALRPYQEDGLVWLAFNYLNKRSCILADEMGLGKTMQSVAFMKFLHDVAHVRGPTLVIAPLSTLAHWQREIEACTDLNCVIYHGDDESRRIIRAREWWFKEDGARQLRRLRITKFNVLLTTYEVFMSDAAVLQRMRWPLLIVDEAQRLKNASSRFYQQADRLKTEFRLLLSGTPIQNNLSELWSLLHFLARREFASEAAFLDKYGHITGGATAPAPMGPNEGSLTTLNDLIRPYLLRRNKANVEKALKPLRETVVHVSLTPLQKKYYKAVFDRNAGILHAVARRSTGGMVPSLMNISMQLRKCCNHPFMVEGAEESHVADVLAEVRLRRAQELAAIEDPAARAAAEAEHRAAELGDRLAAPSGKLKLLDKLLPRLRRDGHRVLIFSQFKQMLDILEDYCAARGFLSERIDGSVHGNQRQAAIDRFSAPGSESFVFLLSTRAGGVGINLTAADTVIIFDSDWNPQQDVQAQARAHRIGQKKEVRVFRVLTKGTYEQHVFDSARRKLELERAVMRNVTKNVSDAGDTAPEAGAKPGAGAGPAKPLSARAVAAAAAAAAGEDLEGDSVAATAAAAAATSGFEDVESGLVSGARRRGRSGRAADGTEAGGAREVERLLREGALAAFSGGSADGDGAQMAEAGTEISDDEVERILYGVSAMATTSVTTAAEQEAAAAANEFASAAFVATDAGAGTDVSLDDPKFWEKIGLKPPELSEQEQIARALGLGNESHEPLIIQGEGRGRRAAAAAAAATASVAAAEEAEAADPAATRLLPNLRRSKLELERDREAEESSGSSSDESSVASEVEWAGASGRAAAAQGPSAEASSWARAQRRPAKMTAGERAASRRVDELAALRQAAATDPATGVQPSWITPPPHLVFAYYAGVPVVSDATAASQLMVPPPGIVLGEDGAPVPQILDSDGYYTGILPLPLTLPKVHPTLARSLTGPQAAAACATAAARASDYTWQESSLYPEMLRAFLTQLTRFGYGRWRAIRRALQHQIVSGPLPGDARTPWVYVRGVKLRPDAPDAVLAKLTPFVDLSDAALRRYALSVVKISVLAAAAAQVASLSPASTIDVMIELFNRIASGTRVGLAFPPDNGLQDALPASYAAARDPPMRLTVPVACASLLRDPLFLHDLTLALNPTLAARVGRQPAFMSLRLALGQLVSSALDAARARRHQIAYAAGADAGAVAELVAAPFALQELAALVEPLELPLYGLPAGAPWALLRSLLEAAAAAPDADVRALLARPETVVNLSTAPLPLGSETVSTLELIAVHASMVSVAMHATGTGAAEVRGALAQLETDIKTDARTRRRRRKIAAAAAADADTTGAAADGDEDEEAGVEPPRVIAAVEVSEPLPDSSPLPRPYFVTTAALQAAAAMVLSPLLLLDRAFTAFAHMREVFMASAGTLSSCNDAALLDRFFSRPLLTAGEIRPLVETGVRLVEGTRQWWRAREAVREAYTAAATRYSADAAAAAAALTAGADPDSVPTPVTPTALPQDWESRLTAPAEGIVDCATRYRVPAARDLARVGDRVRARERGRERNQIQQPMSQNATADSGAGAGSGVGADAGVCASADGTRADDATVAAAVTDADTNADGVVVPVSESGSAGEEINCAEETKEDEDGDEDQDEDEDPSVVVFAPGVAVRTWPPPFTAFPAPATAAPRVFDAADAQLFAPSMPAWWSNELDRHLLVAALHVPPPRSPRVADTVMWVRTMLAHPALPFRSILMGGGWPRGAHGPGVSEQELEAAYGAYRCAGLAPHYLADADAHMGNRWLAEAIGPSLVGADQKTVTDLANAHAAWSSAVVAPQPMRPNAVVPWLRPAPTDGSVPCPLVRSAPAAPCPLRDRYAGVLCTDYQYRMLAAAGITPAGLAPPEDAAAVRRLQPPMRYPVAPVSDTAVLAVAEQAALRLNWLVRALHSSFETAIRAAVERRIFAVRAAAGGAATAAPDTAETSALAATLGFVLPSAASPVVTRLTQTREEQQQQHYQQHQQYLQHQQQLNQQQQQQQLLSPKSAREAFPTNAPARVSAGPGSAREASLRASLLSREHALRARFLHDLHAFVKLARGQPKHVAGAEVLLGAVAAGRVGVRHISLRRCATVVETEPLTPLVPRLLPVPGRTGGLRALTPADVLCVVTFLKEASLELQRRDAFLSQQQQQQAGAESAPAPTMAPAPAYVPEGTVRVPWTWLPPVWPLPLSEAHKMVAAAAAAPEGDPAQTPVAFAEAVISSHRDAWLMLQSLTLWVTTTAQTTAALVRARATVGAGAADSALPAAERLWESAQAAQQFVTAAAEACKCPPLAGFPLLFDLPPPESSGPDMWVVVMTEAAPWLIKVAHTTQPLYSFFRLKTPLRAPAPAAAAAAATVAVAGANAGDADADADAEAEADADAEADANGDAGALDNDSAAATSGAPFDGITLDRNGHDGGSGDSGSTAAAGARNAGAGAGAGAGAADSTSAGIDSLFAEVVSAALAQEPLGSSFTADEAAQVLSALQHALPVLLVWARKIAAGAQAARVRITHCLQALAQARARARAGASVPADAAADEAALSQTLAHEQAQLPTYQQRSARVRAVLAHVQIVVKSVMPVLHAGNQIEPWLLRQIAESLHTVARDAMALEEAIGSA